jgi:uncharacterized membrane protein YfcA
MANNLPSTPKEAKDYKTIGELKNQTSLSNHFNKAKIIGLYLVLVLFVISVTYYISQSNNAELKALAVNFIYAVIGAFISFLLCKNK